MTQKLDLILLVDDDDTTNHVNKRLLSRLDVAREIRTVSNGQEALDYINNSCGSDKNTANPCPDLIFLDIKMPVMDGFSFLDAYENLSIDSETPIVIMMLTSSASFYDLERLKNYKKVRKHLAKALTETDVKEILQDYFSR